MVFENYFQNNSKGVYCCCGAKYNTIYNNNFKNNTEINAEDTTGLINYWSLNSKGGNYWDNYNGLDENQDGFGDTPYPIYRSEYQDNQPLMQPVNVSNCFELKNI